MVGERIFLRAFEYRDLPFFNSLRNDNELYRLTGGNKFYISSEYDRKWIEEKIFNNKDQIYLSICLLEDNQLIGYLSINEIDLLNRKAQWGGIILGSTVSGKGYATEAARLMLRHVFEELGINRFWGYWLVDNKASLRMAQKLGFTEEGRLREFVFKNNRFNDVVLLSMLKRDYSKLSI